MDRTTSLLIDVARPGFMTIEAFTSLEYPLVIYTQDIEREINDKLLNDQREVLASYVMSSDIKAKIPFSTVLVEVASPVFLYNAFYYYSKGEDGWTLVQHRQELFTTGNPTLFFSYSFKTQVHIDPRAAIRLGSIFHPITEMIPQAIYQKVFLNFGGNKKLISIKDNLVDLQTNIPQDKIKEFYFNIIVPSIRDLENQK